MEIFMRRFNLLLILRTLLALVVIISAIACDTTVTTKPQETSYPTTPSIAAVSPKTQNIKLADDFSDSNSGWLALSDPKDETRVAAYENGEFSLSIGKDRPNLSLLAGTGKMTTLPDFTVQVDARKASEENGSACFIIFKDIQGTNINGAGYAMYLADDSAYYIVYYDPGNDKVVQKKTGKLTNVKTGKGTNQLKITRLGTQTDFYVNDYRVESITDNLSMKSIANFGIQTFDKNTSGTKYYFDNYKLYSIE